MRSILVTLTILLFAADASACNRCGRSVCYYAKPVIAAAAVAPIVNTYVVNNVNPSQPLVAQGSSAIVSNGGYQSQVLPLYDPNIVTSNAMQLLKATSDSLPLALRRMEEHAERIVSLQAQAVEKLAAGQAAAQALNAAHQSTTQTQSLSLSNGIVIRSDGTGQLRMEPLASPQVAAITASSTTVTQSVTAETPKLDSLGGSFPMLTQFCSKCHGTDVGQPKGGLYLGSDPNVLKSMRDRWFEITDSVGSGAMPPASEPQPTREQRAAIINEMQALIRSAK